MKSGTLVRVSIRNPLADAALIVYGLHTRPGLPADTIHVPPGNVREVVFDAGEPGTYFYWGTTTHSPIADRSGIDSQLHGAFVIDSPGSAAPRDRIFVLGSRRTRAYHRGQPSARAHLGALARTRTPLVQRWCAGLEWEGKRLAPMIAPRDSFVAEFTPSRAGTFMYHAHSNELFQIALGLYGALIVVDSEHYDPANERLFILGSNGPLATPPVRVNGKIAPDTVFIIAGERYRLRVMNILSDLTARISVKDGDRSLEWPCSRSRCDTG